jgi:hypothetical protein
MPPHKGSSVDREVVLNDPALGTSSKLYLGLMIVIWRSKSRNMHLSPVRRKYLVSPPIQSHTFLHFSDFIQGRKWEEIRDIYVEQMAGLEILHQQVEESLEHLRSETEHLKRADETILRQREALRSTFQDFERKQTRFQLKGKGLSNFTFSFCSPELVQEALEDADHILLLTATVGKETPETS